jgi:DNA-binding PadR family transcriptional regulator
MPLDAPLGEFEVVVLMATMHLETGAFAPAIREEIEQRSGRTLARGAVYITLDRLEDKGLLSSALVDASPARGGRPKRRYKVTAAGVKAVKHTLLIFARMHKGLEPVLGRLS